MDENMKDIPETQDTEEISANEEVQKAEEAEEAEAAEENANTAANDEYKDLYDKYLRLLAEFDNFKKRTQKEKEGIYFSAKSDVVSSLLPVIDNFDRAEKVIEDEAVAEGVRLIHKQFDEFLKKLGVEEIPAQDCEFDPNFHSAVVHEEVEGGPENTVSEVLQKGYKLGDRVIRHAMVKVIN